MKYSLRSLMIVVTLAAFICAGYGVALRRVKERQRAIRRVEELGGFVSHVDLPGGIRAKIGSLLFSDRYALYEVEEVTFLPSPPETTDDELQIVREFPLLDSLSVHSSQITDRGLEALQSLPRLRALSLYKTPIRSESSLTIISNLKHLKYLLVPNSTPTNFRSELENIIGAKGEDNSGDDGDLFIIDGRRDGEWP